jgi:hypothetical protein
LWPGIAAGERRRPAASSNTSKDIAPSLREQIVDRPALSLRRGARGLDARPLPSRGRRFRIVESQQSNRSAAQGAV